MQTQHLEDMLTVGLVTVPTRSGCTTWLWQLTVLLFVAQQERLMNQLA